MSRRTWEIASRNSKLRAVLKLSIGQPRFDKICGTEPRI